jgi:hypothetical protein
VAGPEHARTDLKQLFDEALRPLFGDNLERYYAEVERHDAEVRELQDRARRAAQELITGALDRLTFFGGERLALLPEAERITQARRTELERELHEALLTARETHQRRVAALRVVPDEE